MKTPPEPRIKPLLGPGPEWLHYLEERAEMRVSDYFEPHDDQRVTVRRLDLRRIIKEYKANAKG